MVIDIAELMARDTDALIAEEAAQRRALGDLDFGAVIEQHGTWAVTGRGVECLVRDFTIEREWLFERDWPIYMAGGEWAAMYDFLMALAAGQRHHYPNRKPTLVEHEHPARDDFIPTGRRYRILKRDGFRCQLCGKTAQQGATLEVDHRIPRAKGGDGSEANLWTLCWACNSGKSDTEL